MKKKIYAGFVLDDVSPEEAVRERAGLLSFVRTDADAERPVMPVIRVMRSTALINLRGRIFMVSPDFASCDKIYMKSQIQMRSRNSHEEPKTI